MYSISITLPNAVLFFFFHCLYAFSAAMLQAHFFFFAVANVTHFEKRALTFSFTGYSLFFSCFSFSLCAQRGVIDLLKR